MHPRKTTLTCGHVHRHRSPDRPAGHDHDRRGGVPTARPTLAQPSLEVEARAARDGRPRSLHAGRADARTRTGDPFITSASQPFR
jgi:hypothetical protein